MGKISAEAFKDWLHPSDVIEFYHQQREPYPREFATAMLIDGKLRAGASQLVMNGRDHGAALIPPQVWGWASKTEVWSTGWFQLTHVGDSGIVSVSAHDVRIDPELQKLPPPIPKPLRSPSAQPLSDARLETWGAMFFAEYPTATEAQAEQA